jgi:predicted nucleotidyltransferase
MSILTLETQQQIIERVLQAQEERQQFLQQMRERQQKGFKVAQKIAYRLKTEFGANKVVLFGSFLDPEQMSLNSDIDLAVWGLPPVLLYQAGAAIEQGHDFAVDLMEAERVKPHIRAAITQGIEL